VVAGGDVVVELRPKMPPTFCSKDWNDGDDLQKCKKLKKSYFFLLHFGELGADCLTKFGQRLAGHISDFVQLLRSLLNAKKGGINWLKPVCDTQATTSG
jgi:hypothetical protein